MGSWIVTAERFARQAIKAIFVEDPTSSDPLEHAFRRSGIPDHYIEATCTQGSQMNSGSGEPLSTLSIEVISSTPVQTGERRERPPNDCCKKYSESGRARSLELTSSRSLESGGAGDLARGENTRNRKQERTPAKPQSPPTHPRRFIFFSQSSPFRGQPPAHSQSIAHLLSKYRQTEQPALAYLKYCLQ